MDQFDHGFVICHFLLVSGISFTQKGNGPQIPIILFVLIQIRMLILLLSQLVGWRLDVVGELKRSVNFRLVVLFLPE